MTLNVVSHTDKMHTKRLNTQGVIVVGVTWGQGYTNNKLAPAVNARKSSHLW